MQRGLEALFDSVDVLLWTVREDEEERIYFERVNQAYAKLTGRRPKHYNGKLAENICTPEEYDVIKKALQWAKLGKLHTYEQTVDTAEGRKHLLVNVVPLDDTGGGIHGFAASAVDITGRKLVERERDRHMRITHALYELARMTSTTTDIETLLKSAAVLLSDNPHVLAGGLYVLEPASNTLTLRESFGAKSDFYMRKPEIKLNDPVASGAVEAPGFVAMEDFDGRRELPDGTQVSMISVAMRSGAELIGVMSMLLRDRVLDMHTRGFLETVASELGRTLKRKRSEQALRESEERHRAFTEEALVGVYIFFDDKFHFVNPEMEKITGYSSRELLQMDPWSLLPPGERQRLDDLNAAELQANRPRLSNYTMRIVRKNGTPVVLEVKTRQIQYQGKYANLGNCTDITERIRAREKEEEYLRNLEFISRTAMGFVEQTSAEDIYLYIGEHLRELAGEGIVIVSSYDSVNQGLLVRAVCGVREAILKALNLLGREIEGSFFKINRQGREGLTTGRLERVEGGLYELGFQQIPKPLSRSIENLLGLGEMYAIGITRQKELFGAATIILFGKATLNNKEIIETFIRQSSVALQRRLAEDALQESCEELERRVEERTAELRAANLDLKNEIADRLKVADALRESEERYRKVNESIQDVIFSLSPEGEVLFLSGACEKIFGVPSEILIGKNFFEAAALVSVSLERLQEVAKSYRKSLEKKEENLNYEFVIERRGERRYLEVSERVIYDEGGKVVNSYGVVRDFTDRKLAQDSLQESEERYRALTDQALAGVYIYDRKGRFLFVNPAMERITGYSEKELLNMDTKVFEVPDRLKTDEIREEVRQQEDPDVHRYFMHLVRKDGQIAVLDIQTRPITYQGQAAVLGNCIDITERRKIEEALRESEEKHRVLLSSIQAPVLALNKEMEIRYCNRAYEEFVGRKASEIIEKKLPDLFPDFTRTLSYKAYLETLETGQMHEVEGWYQNKYMKVSVYPTPWGILAIAVNVTEQKKAQIALQESEEKYRTLVEHSNDGIAIIQDEKLVYVNKRLAEIAGYTVEEIEGRRFAEFIHAEELSRLVDYYQRRMAGQDAPTRYESRLLTKYGDVVDVDLHVTLIGYQGKQAEFVVIRDIRERKRTEEALRESEERYRRTFDSMAEAIHVIDKDFRILLANQALYRWLSELQLDSEPFGKTVFQLFPFLTEKIRDEYLMVFNTGDPLITEETTQVGDRNFITETRKIPILVEGEVNRVVTIIQDITERKRSETALREAHERFLTVLDSLDSGVYVADMNTFEVLFANRKMTKYFGDIEGKICWQVLQKDQSGPCEFCTNDKLLNQDGEPAGVYAWEFQNTINDLWCEVRDRAIRWVDGRMARLEIAMDVTERKRMEEELKKSRDELELRVQERTRELEDINVELMTEIAERKRAQENLGRERQAFAIIAEAALSSDTIPNLCFRVLSGLAQTLGFKIGFIQLYDNMSRTLVLKATLGLEGAEPVEYDAKPQSIDNQNYIGTYVARTLKPVFAPDIGEHEIFERFKERILRYDIKSLVAWPVLSQTNQLLGIMQFMNNYPMKIPEGDSLFFKTVAGMFATVLERKQAEKALVESEERYRILSEEAMVGVYVSREGRFIFVNPAMEKITGYTRDELLELDNYELIFASDLEKIHERKKNRRPGESDQYSFRIRRKNGGISTVEVRTRPITYRGETVYLGNCVDISELLLQRRQIEQAKRAWESTFDSIVDMVMILDTEGHIMRANRAVIDYAGTNLEELLGLDYREVYHIDAGSYADALEVAKKRKILEHFEITDPVSLQVFSISVSPLFDQLGEAIAVVHVARDITGLRKVEQALASSEAQFRALAESARDIIFSIDSGTKLSYINPAIKEILGVEPREITGIGLTELFRRRDITYSTKKRILTLLKSGVSNETIPFLEIEFNDDKGRLHVLEVSARRLENQIVGIARDITDRKKMQNQLVRASKLASLGTLAAGIAHQVNNPLAIMLSTSTVLQDLLAEEKNIPEGFRSEASRYLSMMEMQVERTKSVVATLLEFTQPKEFEIQPVRVNQIVQEAVGFISQHLSMERIKLGVSMEPSEPLVLADPVSLQQVVINVIQNAYDALEGEGSIDVSTELATDLVKIKVTDDGPGVPSDLTKEIFEPLFTTKMTKGTGLGLAVGIMLLERFSGRIYLEDSGAKRGASFVIELPIHNKEKDES